MLVTDASSPPILISAMRGKTTERSRFSLSRLARLRPRSRDAPDTFRSSILEEARERLAAITRAVSPRYTRILCSREISSRSAILKETDRERMTRVRVSRSRLWCSFGFLWERERSFARAKRSRPGTPAFLHFARVPPAMPSTCSPHAGDPEVHRNSPGPVVASRWSCYLVLGRCGSLVRSLDDSLIHRHVVNHETRAETH